MTKRTYVLIPGSGGMAWYWHRIVPLLRDAGHEAIAIDLPGDDPASGLNGYAREAVQQIGDRSNLVLVGQSLGAFTLALVAKTVHVAAIVFVNAMIPVPRETPGQWWDHTGQPQAQRAAARTRGYSQEFDLQTYFLHDVPKEVLAGVAPREQAETVFGSPCDFTKWPNLAIKVAAGADDRFFPLEFQRRVAAERLAAEVDELPGGHLIALAQPVPLARYLIEV